MSDALFSLTSLAECGVTLYDCEHATPLDEGEGYPYLAIPNLKGGRVDLTDVRRVSREQLTKWNRRVTPRGGDIIMTRRGRVGDTAVVPDGIECTIGQNLVILRSESNMIDQEFLRWALRGPLYNAEVQRLLNVGAVFDSLNCSDIPKIRIPVPDLAEQRAIAGVLGALDDKIESNRRVAEISRELGLTMVRSSLERSIAHVSLGGLVKSISRGVAPSYADSEIGAPLVLNQRCVRGGRVVMDAARRMKHRRLSPERMASPGDVLVNSTGTGTLGRVARWSGSDVFVDGHVSVVKPDPDRLPPTVLAYLLLQSQAEIEGLAEGSTGQTELSPKRLAGLELAVPNEREAALLEAELLLLEDAGERALREVSTLAALRDALLPELLSGRRRVSEAASNFEWLT